MKHKIDPKVDCVFKAILGSEKNKNLLIHFLNAILEPKEEERIVEVTIINPFNEREFTSDKLTVVDVKARDKTGRLFQIEIQLLIHPDLEARMLYTWTSLYHGQTQKGEGFDKLFPVVSIWILNENLFTEIEDYHLSFFIFDPAHQIRFSDHFSLHILQLPLFQTEKVIRTEKERWIYFFKEGENVDPQNPPDILKNKEMEQAMSTLTDFSENEKNYYLYQSRLEAQLLENTWQHRIERAEQAAKDAVAQAKEAKKAEKDAVAQAKEAKKAEKDAVARERKAIKEALEKAKMAKEALEREEQLLALLKKAGIDPKQDV